MDPSVQSPEPLRPAEVFSLCLAAYANLRGYVADRFGETDPDVGAWLADRGVAWVEGVPEADALAELYTTARSSRLPGVPT